MISTVTTDHSAGLPEPRTIADLHLRSDVLPDLAIKTLLQGLRLTGAELANQLKLAPSVISELMEPLYHDGFVNMVGAAGIGGSNAIFSLTQKGRARADEALKRSGYIGPAPVSLEQYSAQVLKQRIQDDELKRAHVERALQALVLSPETTRQIGRAVTSRRPTLIYGQPGNGKTTVLRALASGLGGSVLMPYAVEMLGEVIRLFDASKHQPVHEGGANGASGLPVRTDRRWLPVRRPVIWASGELTLPSLELSYDMNGRLYEAPLQMKANGGAFIIDDFGRQQISPVVLLNRLITGLEAGVDYLTMHTGQTVEVPFDCAVMFSTNLTVTELVDEAFLRRIRYKVEIPDPTVEEYRTIFEAACAEHGLQYDDRTIDHLLGHWYEAQGRGLRGCHPRDIVEALVTGARYDGDEPTLSPAAIDEVCSTYFVSSIAVD